MKFPLWEVLQTRQIFPVSVTGTAGLVFEQGNGSGGLFKSLSDSDFYESAFRTIANFAFKVKLNTMALEAVLLQFHSAEVKET